MAFRGRGRGGARGGFWNTAVPRGGGTVGWMNSRFPNRGQLNQDLGTLCFRCGQYGHIARLCNVELQQGEMIDFRGDQFGPARGTPRAGMGYSQAPGSVCGHCTQMGHGRADCRNPGLNGQFHLGGRNRCTNCIGVANVGGVVLTPQSSGVVTPVPRPVVNLPRPQAYETVDLGVVQRDGQQHRFVITGAIRAVQTTPAAGRRSFWTSTTTVEAELPAEIKSRFGRISWVSLSCEIVRSSAATTTGTLSYGWFSAAQVPTGADFTPTWLQEQWSVERLQAASEDAGRGVSSVCNFEDERGARRISRGVYMFTAGTLDSSRFAPTFCWNNSGTATYDVRYRFCGLV